MAKQNDTTESTEPTSTSIGISTDPTPIRRLADRLAAAWEANKAADALHKGVRIDRGATQAERDFIRRNDRNGLHALISKQRATTLEEAMIRLAAVCLCNMASVNSLLPDIALAGGP